MHEPDRDRCHAPAPALLALLADLAAHDRSTHGHSERVRLLVDMLAEELRLPLADRDRLRCGALLHDIGKLEVPARILNKPGRLDPEEWEIVQRHPEAGMRVASDLLEWLGPWSLAIEHHHEWFDGAGYPHGTAGEAISVGGRIVAVADAFDTLTSARPYRRPSSAARARREIAARAGRQFDPAVVRAFLNISPARLWVRVGLRSWLSARLFLPARLARRCAEVGRLAGGARVALAGLRRPRGG